MWTGHAAPRHAIQIRASDLLAWHPDPYPPASSVSATRTCTMSVSPNTSGLSEAERKAIGQVRVWRVANAQALMFPPHSIL